MRTAIALIAAAALGSALPLAAQERKDPGPELAAYRVQFDIRDASDTTAKAPRRYTMIVNPGSKSTLRVGTRVPYATGSLQPGTGQGGGVTPLVSTQYQYADIGVNIDCTLQEAGAKVRLNADLEMSSVLKREEAGIPHAPTIASIRVSIGAALAMNKPVLVASVEDPVTLHKFDVEAGVTRLP